MISAGSTGLSYSSTSSVRSTRYREPAPAAGGAAAGPIVAPILGVRVNSAKTDDGAGNRSCGNVPKLPFGICLSAAARGYRVLGLCIEQLKIARLRVA